MRCISKLGVAMTKKIVHLVYSFNIGGLERVIVNLINSSCEAEHIIITLTPGQELAGQLNPHTTFYCLDKKPGNDISSHLRLHRLLRKIRPDVLHTYNFGTFEYQLTAFLAGVPKRVHAEHGRDGEYDERTRRRRTLVRRFVLPVIHHYAVVSPDLYQWAKTDLKISEPKLQLVYNGIDTKAFECQRQIAEKKSPIFITVGRLAEVKNQTLLVDAFGIMRKNHSQYENATLLIIGDGPLRSELSTQIESLGLAHVVSLLGSRDDIAEQLKNADVFVLTSNYEAMPMTVLEAMAAGLPVVSTNVGGVSNIVKDRETGFLVEAKNPKQLADAMAMAASAERRVRDVAQKGNAMVLHQYSVEAMKSRYFDLYDN